MQQSSKKMLVFLFPLGSLILLFVFSRAIDSSQFSLRSIDAVALVSDTPASAEISHDVKFSDSPVEAGVRAGSVAGISVISEVSLSVTVKGPFKDTLRILVPLEATVLSKGIRQEETFQNLHAFTVSLELTPKETKTFRFRYRLPAFQSPYTLRLSPGRSKISYQLKMFFPDNLEAEKTDFSGSVGYSNIGRANGSLTPLGRDKFFIIPFGRALGPLAFLKGEIIDLKTIRLRFNRSVSKISGSDLLNFSMKDMNEKNPEISDRLFITKSLVAGREITFTVHGQTIQPGESYELIVTGLSDRAGNFLEPLPSPIILRQPVLD